jgi:cell shape-determining protein MreC
MWKALFDLVRHIFTINETLQQMREELKETRQQTRNLAENQLRLEFEIRLMKEREAWQQKAQTLEAENQQLREQLKLLPPSSEDTNK